MTLKPIRHLEQLYNHIKLPLCVHVGYKISCRFAYDRETTENCVGGGAESSHTSARSRRVPLPRETQFRGGRQDISLPWWDRPITEPSHTDSILDYRCRLACYVPSIDISLRHDGKFTMVCLAGTIIHPLQTVQGMKTCTVKSQNLWAITISSDVKKIRGRAITWDLDFSGNGSIIATTVRLGKTFLRNRGVHLLRTDCGQKLCWQWVKGCYFGQGGCFRLPGFGI